MNNYKENARLFKAFCDESRLKIIEELQSGEQCACNLLEVMPISQSTLSHHMKILTESGIIVSRKEGKWVHYSISDEGMQKAMKVLGDLGNVSNDKSVVCECER